MSYDIDQGTGTGGGVRLGQKVVELYETTKAQAPVGYEMTISKSGASTAAPRPYQRSIAEIQDGRLRRDPAVRDAIRRALVIADQLSEQMAAALESGELIELSNLGFQLEEVLRELWSYRNQREGEWGDLLNLVQTALAQEEFECFSELQCKAIHRTIVDHLAMGSVDDDDIARAVKLLRESGLDPWKAISGKAFSDENDG